MLNLTKDTGSLNEFKRNTTELVVQDAEPYQALLNAAELIKTLKGIKRMSEKGMARKKLEN